jgi:hypothetical protein
MSRTARMIHAGQPIDPNEESTLLLSSTIKLKSLKLKSSERVVKRTQLCMNCDLLAAACRLSVS